MFFHARCPMTADEITKQAWQEMHSEAKQVVVVAKARPKAIRDAIRYKVEERTGEIPAPYPQPIAISIDEESPTQVAPLPPLASLGPDSSGTEAVPPPTDHASSARFIVSSVANMMKGQVEGVKELLQGKLSPIKKDIVINKKVNLQLFY